MCVRVYIYIYIYITANGLSPGGSGYTWSVIKVRELIAVKLLHTSLLNITVVAIKTAPLGKLCTDVSAKSTLQNNFGTGFVEWPS